MVAGNRRPPRRPPTTTPRSGRSRRPWPASAMPRSRRSGTRRARRCRSTSDATWASSAGSASRCPRSTAARERRCSLPSSSRRSSPRSAVPAAFQVFEANTGPAKVVSLIGTDDQKQRPARHRPRRRDDGRGDLGAGRGVGRHRHDHRAKHSNGSWTLNGSKRWISNGGEADLYLVYTRLSDDPRSKGIGALIVEADRPGVSFGAQERLMGFAASPRPT